MTPREFAGSIVLHAGAVKRPRSTIPAHMEPEHRRAVRTRLAELLGRNLDRVVSPAVLAELSRDTRRLNQAIETLQKDFGVSVDPRAIQGARTVNHLVTLVAGAARRARRTAAANTTTTPADSNPLEPLAPPDAAPAAAARQARSETYESPVAYEGERIHAAAVYCSDGRIGDHVDDFLHNGLGLPRYDRLACPGGPVALTGRFAGFWECRGVEEQLRFLLQVHDVRQVVLVAHQPCAYYLNRLGVPEAGLEAELHKDLDHAAFAVRRADPGIEVAAFMAWLDGGTVRFEKVLATATLDARVSRWRGQVRA